MKRFYPIIKIAVIAFAGTFVQAENLNLIDCTAMPNGNNPKKIVAEKPAAVLIADPRFIDFKIGLPSALKMKSAKSSTIQINFLPANSSDARWGDHTTTWPVNASNALLYAAGIWENIIASSVPITIDAGWVDNLGAGILGHSGSLSSWRDFSGAPVAGTFYSVCLGNALHGSDLDASDPDIYMGFSSSFSWYTGTDGNPSPSEYDFVTVVLHEICHGLGFAGSLYVETGVGKWWHVNYPNIYDTFAEDNSGTSLIDTGTYPKNSVALKNALTSDNIFFDGVNANAANGGNRPELYAPAIWNGGSSYSHLGEIFNGTPNALMTYSIGWGESEHSPGPVTEGLLQDIGWVVGGSPATQTYALSVQSQNPNSGVNITVTPLDNNGAGNGTTTFTRTYDSNTTVNLTAPATAGSNPFDHWLLDGGSAGSTVNLSVDMLENHTAIAVYQSSSPGTSTYTIAKLKAKIKWKAGDFYRRGDVKIKGTVPTTLTDLNFLNGSYISNLMLLNSSVTAPSGDFLKINKKGTAVKFKTKRESDKLLITTKLTLKNGVLTVILKGKNVYSLYTAFGMTNTDSGGWQSKIADILLEIDIDGNYILGLGSKSYQYKTIVDKKTKIK